ncbi:MULTISPECIES: histidine phosphatase family protein [unclassified Streptomyces]|uniref:SixA phosphatase family protein n=1 Tax=unclassified Streptomyces TaxID=2593676 RepID=UPI002E0DAFA8|nr:MULTISPECIES: histidine phosphatase family protein [unclassified Streptomyces]WSR23934.1 histidine phosphatase family protein [Streptomyces sp. NBC_01205]
MSERGRADAPRTRRWLADSGFEPDLVLCSPARRTRQTWQLAVPALQDPPPVVYDERAWAPGRTGRAGGPGRCARAASGPSAVGPRNRSSARTGPRGGCPSGRWGPTRASVRSPRAVPRRG